MKYNVGEACVHITKHFRALIRNARLFQRGGNDRHLLLMSIESLLTCSSLNVNGILCF